MMHISDISKVNDLIKRREKFMRLAELADIAEYIEVSVDAGAERPAELMVSDVGSDHVDTQLFLSVQTAVQGVLAEEIKKINGRLRVLGVEP